MFALHSLGRFRARLQWLAAALALALVVGCERKLPDGRVAARAPVQEDLHIMQMARYCMWSGRELPLEPEQITVNSASKHMIPADAAVRRTLLHVRKNDVVEFTGYLVSIRADDGWMWGSSMNRTDSGGGAWRWSGWTR